MLRSVEFILLLLAAVAALVAVARRVGVPYPVLLVLGGLALGFVPRLPRIEFSPDLIFLVVLPPLLYEESWFTSWREFRRNLRPISLLAIGLVAVTTVAVAFVARLVIPGLAWPAALVLGAVVAPTDEVAVLPVVEAMGVPRRIAIIVSDEALVNDAISLVIYRLAAAAVVAGGVAIWQAGTQFLLVSAGGVGIGLAAGWLVARFYPRLDDPPVEITLSLLLPFVAYVPAERLGASGVLAVVALGLYLGREGSRMYSPRTRLNASAFWQMLAFLLNGLVFILLGLQLPQILGALSFAHPLPLVAKAVAISLTCVLVRIAWVFPATYVPRALSRSLRARDPAPPWQYPMLLSWTGIRGGLSLAAALAIPLTTRSGAPFPHRNMIVFLTFGVILTTLVLQGLTLPLLIRRLRLPADQTPEQEEAKARARAAHAALARLEELAAEEEVPPDMVDHLRKHYQLRIQRLSAPSHDRERHSRADRVAAYRALRKELLAAERTTIVELRDEGVIDDETMHRIEHDLDLEEVRLGGARG